MEHGGPGSQRARAEQFCRAEKETGMNHCICVFNNENHLMKEDILYLVTMIKQLTVEGMNSQHHII